MSDRQRPFCDIVMKGGVTSGIVYPRAIGAISRAFTFKNVGGTSAGAIAACLTAAAEYRRSKEGSDAGFELLEKLPDELKERVDGRSKLFSLFRPDPSTRRIFRVLTAALGNEPAPVKLGRVVTASLVSYWFLFLIALYPIAATMVRLGYVIARPPALTWQWVWIAGGSLLELLLSLISTFVFFGVLVLLWTVLWTLPRNRFGLCSGRSHDDKPALMEWLETKIETTAGIDRPLTFGDLEDAGVRLRMVTTNLTHGRPYTLPFAEKELYFRRSEMERILPTAIVELMVSKAKEEAARRRNDAASANGPGEGSATKTSKPGYDLYATAVSAAESTGIYPLPPTRDLPLLLAARMSLSFPVLFTLVPLMAVDYTWTTNQDSTRWDFIDVPRLELCWFIDGGLTSNFPIAFFDSPLPKWPTFGLDLREFHPQHPKSDIDEDRNVWMVDGNGDGRTELWNRFATALEKVPVGGYLASILNAMQNWRDNTQQRVNGFRDRIAHIKLSADEGGLNLDMPEKVIEKLAERGRFAGTRLVKRFTPASAETMNWDNHRWLRLLATTELTRQWLHDISTSMEVNPNGGTSYDDLLQRSANDPHTGYVQKLAHLRAARLARKAAFAAAETAMTAAQPQEDEVPNPLPELRVTARF
jgi:predicted acylesterase/phospholipase RssA